MKFYCIKQNFRCSQRRSGTFWGKVFETSTHLCLPVWAAILDFRKVSDMKKINSFFTKNHSTVKFLNVMFAGLLACSFLFASCSTESNDKDDDDDDYKKIEKELEEKEAKKKAEEIALRSETYASILGEWVRDEKYDWNKTMSLDKVIITPTSVVLEGPGYNTMYSIKPETNFRYFVDEWGYSDKTSWFFYSGDDSFLEVLTNELNSYGRLFFVDNGVGAAYFVRATDVTENSGKDDGGKGGSDSSLSVKGTYTGSDRYNSSITMNDNGTWTFSTTKPGSAVTGGTYTVSGSKITMKYSARGTDFEETFTVTDSGSKSTWKTSQNGASTLFSTLFMEVGTEYTFIKS